MKAARVLACVIVVAVCALSLGANWLAPAGYAKQFREAPSAPPSRAIFLAPTKLAAIALRAYFMARASRFCSLPPPLWSQPRWPRSSADWPDISAESGSRRAAFTDLFLSLPWLFLLITVRALLPLNVSPLVSVLITFLILGLLGWAASARVLSTSADALRNSDFVLQARASGLHGRAFF